MALLQRANLSLRQQGVTGTIHKLYCQLVDYLFDRRYGIDTRTWARLNQLTIASDNQSKGRAYKPTRVVPLRKLFHAIQSLDPVVDRVLVDFGCGKGRVLLVAAEFGFRAVRGVEFAQELCAIAQSNCAAYQAKTGSKTEFQIVAADVVNYAIHTDENIFFFFNPFDEEILHRVLHQISASLLAKPRKILIIYHNPVKRQTIEAWDNLIRVQELNFWGYDFVVYANRAASLL